MKAQMLLDQNILRNQFIITKYYKYIPINWDFIEFKNWFIGYHRELPIIEVHDDDNNIVGFILGFPIDLKEGLINSHYILKDPIDYQSNDVIKRVENEIYGLAGRFVFLILFGKYKRLYVDPNGSLSAVYSIEDPIVCSTASVIGKSEKSNDWDEELLRKMPTRFIPFGLTPHKSMKRLLPNHYLDLDTWRVERHYPTQDVFNNSINNSSGVKNIAKLMGSYIEKLVPHGLSMTLTAGSDNRVMLACSKPYKDKIVYFTKTQSNKIDIYMTTKLRKELKLKHYYIDSKPANKEEQYLNSYLSGFCMDISSTRQVPMHKQKLVDIKFQLTGSGGEIGKCFYWNKTDNKTTLLDGEELLRRMTKPLYQPMKKAARDWLNGLNEFNTFTILDLLFVEQNTGCRAGPNMYPYDYLSITPIHIFTHRRIMKELMLLPPEYKRKNKLCRDIVSLTWPELSHYPINEYMGIRKYPHIMKRKLKTILKPLVYKYYNNYFENKDL